MTATIGSKSPPRLRPLQPSDWGAVEALEAALFPDLTDTFDRSFFRRIGGLGPKLIRVVQEDGAVVGYLSLVPLTPKGVLSLVQEGKTTIAEMSADDFADPPAQPAAYFVEVIAAATNASRQAKYRLVREAAKQIASLRAYDWYAVPISADGERIARKFGFTEIPHSGGSSLRMLRRAG